ARAIRGEPLSIRGGVSWSAPNAAFAIASDAGNGPERQDRAPARAAAAAQPGSAGCDRGQRCGADLRVGEDPAYHHGTLRADREGEPAAPRGGAGAAWDDLRPVRPDR